MVIQPRTLGYICTTAHPEGCAGNVRDQIAATVALGRRADGPRRVLVIGAASGYGLAARIVAGFGFGAATLGVLLEKPGKPRRCASAGWYNACAFGQQARAAGQVCPTVLGDAFAEATRTRTMEAIATELGGPVDLVLYSLAAPQRQLPDGRRVHTAIKPIGAPFHGHTIDTDRDRLQALTIEAASAEEIADTTTVMGGAPWAEWIAALADADLLAADARTVAFSYLGPELTWPIYRHGTIGRAKEHLQATANALSRHHGRPDFARVALLPSTVTQASAAIPVIPLYLSTVMRVLREQGRQEGAIEAQNRLFREHLYPASSAPPMDAAGRLRLDDRELAPAVQDACRRLWTQLDADNFARRTDYAAYKHAFLNLFGFGRAKVDYDADTDPVRALDCLTPDAPR